MRLINLDEIEYFTLVDKDGVPRYKIEIGDGLPTVKAIPTEQLLSILPKYDDYIHTKTYPHNETMEDIYSKGHEEGWHACLKAIKEELEDWEKENGRSK